jgi:Ala-tRNA(Pro) deacylase
VLGLVQGSVTPFGVLNDVTREVLLVFDERLEHQRFDAHPMVNTATMFVEMDEVLPLFVEHGTRVVFADLSCAGVE